MGVFVTDSVPSAVDAQRRVTRNRGARPEAIAELASSVSDDWLTGSGEFPAIDENHSFLICEMKKWLVRLPVRFIIVFSRREGEFKPAIHAYYKSDRDRSRKIARALPKKNEITRVLHVALEERYASENFLAAGGDALRIAGNRVSNVGAVACKTIPEVVVACLNLKAKMVEDKPAPARGQPWDSITLDALYWSFYVNPLEHSRRAYAGDLKRLLSKHHGEWVVYRGQTRIGFFQNQQEAVQACEAREIPWEEVFIRRIVREPEPYAGWRPLAWE